MCDVYWPAWPVCPVTSAASMASELIVLVAARIDRGAYDWLMQYGKAYSTRINSILRTVMERAR